jgi:threonine/homoserine/homoserine lactone efflux protein
MDLILVSQIIIVCLLGAISPGPSMVVIINNAITKSRINGIITAIAHGIGIAIYALFAVLGIGLIIQTGSLIFNGLQILSIIFLFYLGVQSLRNTDEIDFEDTPVKSGFTSFTQGFAISILNPKIFVWFVAIYSQFMSVDNNLILNATLVITAGVVDTVWYILLVYLVTSGMIFGRIKKNYRMIEKIIGVLFIILSIGLGINIFLNF